MAKRKKKKVNIKCFVILGLFILSIIATVYMLYSLSLLNGIENKNRFLISINLIIILIGIIYAGIVNIKKRKKNCILLGIFTVIYSVFLIVGSYYIVKTYKVIDNISSNKTVYYSSLVTLKSNKAESVSDITSGKIGVLKDTSSVDGNQIPYEVLKDKKIKNTVKEYENYVDLINALYDKEVEYIFLPNNYGVMFANVDGEDFEDIEEETKVLLTKEKSIKKESTNDTGTLTKPFTVLVMGVDSEKENIKGASFNGDALMLITFNPTTLNTTILSIPRDSYVPIACFTGKIKNKITHAAWYGEDCMMETIEDFTGIDIDYYVKINFKGVVKLIDNLGGVEVTVPYSFCEQDSNRKFGKNTLYVKEGKQTLNGEQALALARNRKSNSNKCSSEWTKGIRNDFVRGQNQQLVLRSMLNKLKSVNSLDTVYSLLDTISNSMETNMSTSEILSLYNVGKDIIKKSSGSNVDNLLGFQRLYLNGQDAYIYDQRSKLNLYNYVLYDASVKAVTDAMKVNLNLTKPTLAKKFSFDINEEYEETVIGKNVKGTTSIVKLPSFIGMNESKAKTKANSLDLKVTFKYVTTGSGNNLTVIKQNYNAGTDTSYVSSLILTVLKKEETPKPTESNTNVDTNTSTNTTTTTGGES